MKTAIALGPTLAYLQALQLACAQEKGWAISAVATTVPDAVRLAREQTPAVAMIGLPSPEGVLAARAILRAVPQCRVFAFGVGRDRAELSRWLDAGATACVAHDEPLDGVIAASRRVLQGEHYCSPSLTGELFGMRARRLLVTSDGSSLTRREVEILDLAAQGLSNKEIAHALSVQVPTVKNHLHSIFGKVGVHNRSDAIRVAYRR